VAFTAIFQARNAIAESRLAEHTTMRVGGRAEMVTLNSREDIPELLAQPRRWLGKGANLLVGDDGLREPVVKLGPAFATLDVGPRIGGGLTRVHAGAGCDLARLISSCIQAGLAGPEGLAGVPATVGGALRMNAGTATCWMFDWVSRVEVMVPGAGRPQWLERAQVPVAYRSNGLPPSTLFLGCEMELSGGDPEQLRGTAARLKKLKAATQPLALPSAGCVFKNPRPDLPAGKLIDELGLKGQSRGAAMVSPVHANFIVNHGGQATTADIVALIRLIRARAWSERGVVLTMEVETWNCPDELHAHPRDLERAVA
jgi:UDP-N-acetylmuramate dehydrogenase